MNNSGLTRRRFIKNTAITLTTASAWPYIVPASVLGFNGKSAPHNHITLGLIGTGNINTRHREAFLLQQDARIIAVCDPVQSRRQPFRERINAAYKSNVCTDYRDFRELLDRKDIDAVCIGTPDHWHAILAARAMQSGKDVYLEKPLTRTVAQGRHLVKIAAAQGRILQTGLQRRSSGAFRYACELVRNGRIGKLKEVEVGIIGINKGVQVGKNFPETPVPEGFDYNLWLGPAPVAPFSPQRVARGNEICYWYYISDYTAGFISGNGVHFVDIAQWGIGDKIAPVEIQTISAEIPTDGLIDDAIAWQAEVLYANGVKMHYSSQDNPYPDGIKFIGTRGWIHISGGGSLSAEPAGVLQSVIGPDEIHLYAGPEHHRNFLDCIKTRRPAVAAPEIGHHATTTCNLVEISALLGRKLKWNAAAERFVADKAADRLLSRPLRAPWRL